MGERPSWALASGLPSGHTACAAMHVAAVIGTRGSRAVDAKESYWHCATGGFHSPRDLALGEALLVDLGLLVHDCEVLRPSDELAEMLAGSFEDAVADIVCRTLVLVPPPVGTTDRDGLLAAIPDIERREQLLLELARRHDDERRAAIGAAGERLVVAEARAELKHLARPDLARSVRRVSVVSDQLGYDVIAPCLQGAPRRLEVKTTTHWEAPTAHIYLTRNEAGAGQYIDGWKLVLCSITDIHRAEGNIVGWWSYADLTERLPHDVDGGEWQQAKVSLQVSPSRAGLPSAVV